VFLTIEDNKSQQKNPYGLEVETVKCPAFIMSSLTPLLEACINDRTRDIIETLIHIGMRRRKALGLKWNQGEDRSIYLTKTATEEAREIPINDDPPASFKGVRATDWLRSQKELQQMLGYQTMDMRLAHRGHEHKKSTVNPLHGLTASADSSWRCTLTFPKSSVTATS
jgi:integrase